MRLRFSIRDLFWLTLVVALAVAWSVDHNRPSVQFPRRWSVWDDRGVIYLLNNETDVLWKKDRKDVWTKEENTGQRPPISWWEIMFPKLK